MSDQISTDLLTEALGALKAMMEQHGGLGCSASYKRAEAVIEKASQTALTSHQRSQGE